MNFEEQMRADKLRKSKRGRTLSVTLEPSDDSHVEFTETKVEPLVCTTIDDKPEDYNLTRIESLKFTETKVEPFTITGSLVKDTMHTQRGVVKSKSDYSGKLKSSALKWMYFKIWIQFYGFRYKIIIF